MKTAITGACGYVGLNLVQTLLDAGHEVVALDRQRSAQLDPRAEWQQIDIFDAVALGQALKGVEVVFHLVAKICLSQEDEATWHINTQGVKAVAETALAHGVRRMVHVSSVASFDMYQCQATTMDETAARSIDPILPVYARSKYAGECELLEVAKRGLEAVICYPTGVFGPVDYGRPLSRINATLLDAARGRIPGMVDGGFDLVDVRDVAHGLMLAAEHGRNGENYLLGGEYIEMVEAYRRAARLVGRHGPWFTLPIKLLKKLVPLIDWFAKRFAPDADVLSEVALTTIETSPRVDHSKARNELGYAPRPINQSLRELMAFFMHSQAFTPQSRNQADTAAPLLSRRAED